MFKLARITFMYWAIECTQNLHLWECSSLQELPSSIGQLNAL
jgi:hypothetical protein